MHELKPESDFIVTVTPMFCRVEHESIGIEQIMWDDVSQVSIITTEEGPFKPDVWLTLLGEAGIVQIPQGCEGYDTVYDIVSTYPGFDFDNVIKAMQCTDNNEFILWKKS